MARLLSFSDTGANLEAVMNRVARANGVEINRRYTQLD